MNNLTRDNVQKFSTGNRTRDLETPIKPVCKPVDNENLTALVAAELLVNELVLDLVSS